MVGLLQSTGDGIRDNRYDFSVCRDVSLVFQKPIEKRAVSSNVVEKVSGQTTGHQAQNQEVVVWCCPLVATAEN